jgi:hypothetical protein
MNEETTSLKRAGRMLALASAGLSGALMSFVCASAGWAAWTSWHLRRIDTADAVRRAVADADLRLYAWEGSGVYVPGLTHEAYETAVRSPCGLRWLAVSDRRGPWIWGRAEVNQIAYAERYNRLMAAQPRWRTRCRPAA